MSGTLAVYRLDPVRKFLDHKAWTASTLAPIQIWVLAKGKKDARRKVMLATHISTQRLSNGNTQTPPWTQKRFVEVIQDPLKIDVRPGYILTADGLEISFYRPFDMTG